MSHFNTKEEIEVGENIYRNVYDGTTHRFSTLKLLFSQWKGSCLKLIWHDLVIFLTIYFLLSLLYRYILFPYPSAKQFFELLCIYADDFSGLIPITFLIGFYVSSVVNRWWDQFMTLPRPDKFALLLVNLIPGSDEFQKNLRLTVMRYYNLSTILVYRLVAGKVHRRFPDFDALIEAKLMLPREAIRFQEVNAKTPYESTWTPLLWASKLITKARAEKKITISPPEFATLQKALCDIESVNLKILNYGWVNFPMAYVHVANISVYLYFLAALFGRQFLQPEEKDNQLFDDIYINFSKSQPFRSHTPDFVVPFFTMIEFFCYMGWIKVAQSLLNPFGDDDEDFKINYLIDRNLQVSYLIVDEADKELEMAKDPFLEAGIEIPHELPYVEDIKRKSSIFGSPKCAAKAFGSTSTTQIFQKVEDSTKEEEKDGLVPKPDQPNQTELAKDIP